MAEQTETSKGNPPTEQNAQARFGTFGGVFTPCTLTILGVIMFMRTGFTTGYAGLWLALAVLGISKLITVLTTLSLSAVATNLKMQGGGPYFMISRVLGPDFGGSIGITLYFAQAVGVAFYVIGFTEALFDVLPLTLPVLRDGAAAVHSWRLPQIVATITVTGLFFVTFKGADVAIKAQYFILAVLLLSVLSFIVGGLLRFDTAVLEANRAPAFTDNIGFWTVFAIFFPATTGITAGVNMSGDLKSPARAIPRGTLAAIGFTAVVYIVQMVVMSGAVPRDAMQSAPFQSLKEISLFSPIIILGVFAATLSSALGSFLGAPRILQAMGRDRLMKAMIFFGKGSGATQEPKRATVLTLVVSVAVIWAGDLNAVAEVISMFFLIAYGMINLSAFVESKSGNPSFRPTFRLFHWSVGLAGAVGCVVAMVMINAVYAVVASVVTVGIYYYLKRQDIATNYGDAKRGYLFKKTRENLLALQASKPHPKSWRPIVTAISEDPLTEKSLLRMGGWLEGERGIYSVLHLSGRDRDGLDKKIGDRKTNLATLRKILDAEKVCAFAEALTAADAMEGLSCFLQSYSMEGIRPNTILISMPQDSTADSRERFLQKAAVIAAYDLNLAVLKPGDLAPLKKTRTIDIWWRGEKNGSLMALFAYLLTLDPTWSNARIRLLRIVATDADEAEGLRRMAALREHIRLPATTEIIRSDAPPSETIAAVSGPVADLVLLGMRAASGEEARRSIEWLEPLLDRLPSTLIVWSNGQADMFV